MSLLWGLSALKIAALLGLFLLLLGLYSLKTIYYYSYQNLAWWMYLAGITLVYLYAIHYSLSEGRYWLIVFAMLSIIIGFMPYEIMLPEITSRVTNPELNISAIFRKLPVLAGVVADVLFYPLLVFIILLMVKKVT